MKIREKLMAVQSELKAPKGQFNDYGKYKYRSCEDILEAVKPLLAKYKCTLTISDEIAQIGDRYYIKAVATLMDAESPESIGNVAYARESLDKKGMDDSQITGTASSYARKYCLNGLFLIDDTKDADTNEFKAQQNQDQPKETKKASGKKATPKQIEMIVDICKKIDPTQEVDEEGIKEWSLEKAQEFIKKHSKEN